ncbi:MAG: TetR/AcrR family transcriptional regulator [Lachnospiraceae bacterium]|nr:TetR/AcrR family transcriptional regulator [Lachnospiraceae bacterium]
MNDKFFDLKKGKQDAMINAALKVFAQYGYRFASTDEMVKEAHISKGLLFHYFGSKLGLYTFVYDYAVRYVSMEISSVIAPSDHDFFELCRKYEAAKLSICRTYPYMFLFLHKAQDEDIEEAELAITDRRTELQALYQQTLQQSDLSSFHSEEEAIMTERIVRVTLNELMDTQLQEHSFEPELMYDEGIHYINFLEKAITAG